MCLRIAVPPPSATHPRPSCWNSEAKRPLKKWRNVSLRLRGGPWRFWGWLRGLFWGRWLELTAVNRQGTVRRLDFWEQILEEKQRSLCGHTSALDYSHSSSETQSSPHVLLDIGNNDTDDPPTVQEEVPPLISSLVFFFVNHSWARVYFFVVRTDCL